ncbi:MAG: nuclear transport factor 2 family protein [Terracidiphilus sp.]
MNRFLVSLSAALLACGIAAAQAPASGVSGPVSPAVAEQGITTTISPEVSQFQKIEDSWSDAVNRRDQYGLELVLSPLFVDISAQGDVTTRNQQVAQVLSGQDRSLYLTQKIVTVRMLGDIAVANGTYTLHHKVNGAEVDTKGIFTHVFERVHGGWVCVNSQRTLLREDDNNGKQKKASNTESPFHIPFFGKSDKGTK